MGFEKVRCQTSTLKVVGQSLQESAVQFVQLAKMQSTSLKNFRVKHCIIFYLDCSVVA